MNTHLPTTILIGTGTICQYKCIFCNNSKQPKISIKFDAMQRALSLFENINIVDLTGYGEFTLHPDYEKIIELMKEKKFKFNISTNGEGMTIEKQKVLEGASIAAINFSINSLNSETYKILSGVNGNLENTLSNFRNLIQKIHPDRLSISMVANRLNYKEMPDFIEFAHEHGIKIVRILAPVHFMTYEDGIDLLYNEEEMEYLQKAHDLAKKYNIKIEGMFLPSKQEAVKNILTKAPISKCRAPWTMTCIAANGDVSPCCFLVSYITGNINEQSFDEIWNGEKYNILRKSIMEGKNLYCQNCTDFA
ncbi:radical SAM protein [bacterium]|jgi:MoaA/NifB/PqqE/SkfB family radical SAM enzyme|nr:radical SAM protein [bacterium]